MITECSIVPLAQVLVFICFGLWAAGTFVVFSAAFFGKMNFQSGGKIDFNNPYHVVLVTTALAWVSMWCFRMMY